MGTHPPTLTRRQRLACAAGAMLATSTVMAGFLLAWHRQSPPVWLTPTADVMAELLACEERPDRATRVGCKQAVAQRRQMESARPPTLAAIPSQQD